MRDTKCRHCGEKLKLVWTGREGPQRSDRNSFLACNTGEVTVSELPDGMGLVVNGRIENRPEKDARGFVLHSWVCRGKR